MRMLQGVAYSQAHLIGWAFHEPKKMPKFEKVFPDRRKRPAQSPEEMYHAMRQWTAVFEAARKGRK